jgi:hypothetical protein
MPDLSQPDIEGRPRSIALPVLSEPTDSGYASAPGKSSAAEVDQDFEVATVLSESEKLFILQDDRDIFVKTFADKLFNDVALAHYDLDINPSITSVLPTLLKEFSVRLAARANGRSHREAVLFVRQYRR